MADGASQKMANLENVADKAKDSAKSFLDQAKSTAGDAYDTVAEKASSALDEKKAGLTGGLTSVADSLRQVGDSLQKAEGQTPIAEYSAKYAETAAEKLEGVAKYFDDKDLKAIARDAEMFARRNPAIFLGAAFALGVFAARFFKSSPRPSINVAGTKPPVQPDHQLTRGAL